MISHLDMIARIATGAALGGIIGFERDIHGRQAGLRTHLLVAMASATFMVVSNHFIFFQGYDSVHPNEADVSRIAASVVSGIGFLAGGAILKTGATVHGLTTAAGLWLVAAIGLAAGGGMYIEGLAVTAMGLIALTLLRVFEDKDDRRVRRQVTLLLSDGPGRIEHVMHSLTQMQIKVADFDYERRVSEKMISIQFDAHIPLSTGVNPFITEIEKLEGISQVHVKGHR